MAIESGHLAVAFVLGSLIAAGAGWVIAGLYRRRMVALMSGAASSAAAGAVAALPASPARPPPRLDLAANRRATRRLLASLTAICLLIALTESCLVLRLNFEATGKGCSPGRLLVLAAADAWPMVLAWGLALRWPWRRVLAGIAVYTVLATALVMWRSNEQQSLRMVGAYFAANAAIPFVITLIIGGSARIRAAAPYLLPPAVLLATSSILMLQPLGSFAATEVGGRFLLLVARMFGDAAAVPATVVLLGVLVPCLLIAWPAHRIGRAIAAAYRRKRVSDLGYLFGAYWLVILLANALQEFAGNGGAGFVVLAAWLWIPLGGRWLKRYLAPAGDPPCLLVLRVFQHDAQVEALFDQVIERWRFTGNTMLIAGTDLISRTLDPDDLFTFIDGRLGQRFIGSEADVALRLAEFDLEPDPDGRYRVNECYCRDTTWESALTALVARCDLVLMDLRGFQAHNRGCRFELGVLARAANLRRVIVLHDAATDRRTAENDIGAAPAGRFHWLDAGHMDTAKAREVLAALFAVPAEGAQDRAGH